MSANLGDKKEDKGIVSSPDRFVKVLGLKSNKDNAKKSFTSFSYGNEKEK